MADEVICVLEDNVESLTVKDVLEDEPDASATVTIVPLFEKGHVASDENSEDEDMDPKITFLGFKVNSKGVSPDPDKTAPLKEAPRPTNIRQVMSFLGAVNYLAEFSQRLADMAEPLRLLTRKN